jgi:hypothetical protein
MPITHATVAPGTDSGDGKISKNAWDEDHVIAGENFGFIGCRASGATTSVGGSWTVLLFPSEDWDTDGYHSTSVNTGRITIPAGLGGKYLVSGHVLFVAGGSGTYDITIDKNAGGSDGECLTRWYAATSYQAVECFSVLDLVAGDFIELKARNTSGTLATTQTWFSAVKLDSGHVGQGVGASVHNSTTQSVTASQENYLTLDTEDFDTDGFHSTVTDTSRLTVPTGLGGKYLVIGSMWSTTNTSHDFRIVKNRTTKYADSHLTGGAGAAGQTHTILDLSAGDYVELSTYPAGNASVGHASLREAQTDFSIMRLDSLPVGVTQSFTPTFKAGATTCTTSQLAAKYVQTGSVIWWRIDVMFSAGGTGVMSITDLPSILQWTAPIASTGIVGGGIWANEGVGWSHVDAYAYSSTEWRFKKYNDYNDYSDTVANTDKFGLEGFIITG